MKEPLERKQMQKYAHTEETIPQQDQTSYQKDLSEININITNNNNEQIIQPSQQYLQQFQQKQEDFYKSLMAEIQQNQNQQDLKSIPFKNLDLKEAKVEKKSENGQTSCEKYLGVFQILILVAIIVNLILQQNVYLIIILIIHVIIAISKSISSTALNHLKYLKTPQQFEKYMNKLKTQNPIIQFFVSSYHEKLVDNLDGGTRSIKKIHFTKSYKFDYQTVQDLTVNTDSLFTEEFKIIKFRNNFKWYCNSPQTQIQWELLKKQGEAEASNYDDIIESWEVSELKDLKYDILTSNKPLPFYYSSFALFLFNIFGMGLIFDYLFYSKLGFCEFYIQKSITSQKNVAYEEILQFKFNQEIESEMLTDKKNVQISQIRNNDNIKNINNNKNKIINFIQSDKQIEFKPIKQLYRSDISEGVQKSKHTDIYKKMLANKQKQQFYLHT